VVGRRDAWQGDGMSDLSERLAHVARALRTQADVEHTLERSVHLAVELLDGCEEAGISLVHHGGTIETPAATSEGVARADALQTELREGPCLDVIWEHETVSSPDLATDGRWATWGPRVVEELGVRSMLCFQLFTDDRSLGALNLYSGTVDGFDADDRVEGLALAAHVAVALAASQEIATLGRAVVARTVIGQAEGILMERFDLEPAAAFAVLRRVSQDTNTRLHHVAGELVRTRRTPGT
jgi:GAF domain-containing protein